MVGCAASSERENITLTTRDENKLRGVTARCVEGAVRVVFFGSLVHPVGSLLSSVAICACCFSLFTLLARLTLKALKTPKTPYRARTAVGRRDKTAGCGQPLPPFSLVEQRSDSRLMERKAHIVFIVRQAELRS